MRRVCEGGGSRGAAGAHLEPRDPALEVLDEVVLSREGFKRSAF